MPKDDSEYTPSLMERILLGTNESDVFIKVSSDFGNSLYEISPLEFATVNLQGFTGRKMLGDMYISGTRVPFNGQYYSLGSTTVLDNSTFLGRDIDIQFDGTLPFPSFQRSYYSPTVSNLTFDGIVDYQLPKDSNLTIYWMPDSLYITERALLIIEGEFRDGRADIEYRTIYKELNDKDGRFTFSVEELKSFHKFEMIRINYAKGYSSTELIEGKRVKFGFLNRNWATIRFAD